MLHKIIELLKSDKFKGAVSVIAAVVMYFTPDHVDGIIETLLGAFGITTMIISKTNEKPHG
jgi:hypothetical protein